MVREKRPTTFSEPDGNWGRASRKDPSVAVQNK